MHKGDPSLKGWIAASAIRLVGAIPLNLGQRFGSVLGRLMVVLNGREVKIARRNISICFPELSEDEIEEFLNKSFQHAGMQLLEIAHLWVSPPKRSLSLIKKVKGRELFEKAKQGNKGLIIILPHLGNWEMINAYLLEDTPIRAMYSPAKLKEVDELMCKGRAQTGLALSAANAKGVSLLITTIKKGGNLAILPDQEPPRDSGEFAPFFDKEALTMTLISKLLLKTGANAVIAYAKRLGPGKGVEVIFKEVPKEIFSEDLRTSVSALNIAVEGAIRENPEQYMWGYKRFRKRPEGEPALYDNLI
jgi:KDO2-lipid IV(A) lauroyltransferase